MISIVNYLFERGMVGDTSTYYPEQQGPITGAVKYWTGIRSRADVDEMVKNARAAEKEKAAEAIKKAGQGATTSLTNDTSGATAAGHALKKGGQAAGEALGDLGKKSAEFAGEHGTTAGVLGGAAIATLAMRRKKAQAQ